MVFDFVRSVLRKPRSQEISIIICSIDDQRFARVSANYAERMGSHPYELIRIADARSLAEGYNRGLKRSRGGIVIFSHDDIEILTADFRERLLAHLDTFDLVGVAGTSRVMNGRWIAAGQPWIHGHVVQPAISGEGLTLDVYGAVTGPAQANIQALDGLFFAAKRWVAESVRFDARTFEGFHLYDIDFTFRAYRAGARIGVANDILIYHQSLGEIGEAWKNDMQHFWKKFTGHLATGDAGPARLHAQERVQSKAQALAIFQQYLQSHGLVAGTA